MKIKAVIFDIDGTFYPNWRMNLMTFPVVLKNVRLYKAFAEVRKEMRLLPEMKVEEFYQVQAEMTAEKLNKSVDQIRKKIEEDIYLEWTAALKRVRPYRGVRDVILQLQDRGFTTACLSDFPILDKLKYFNLHDLFQNSAYSCEDCGYLKPHPAAYEYVRGKVGFKPEEILYVGNSYPYDIVGSKNAGMHAAHISGRMVENDIKADFTFKKYSEFFDRFDKFIEGA